MKKYSNIVRKALVGSVIFTSICLSTQAQTAEQLAEYKAAIKSQENFNKIQREAGMPEMPVLSFKDWEKQEAEKTQTTPISSAQKKLSAEERWEMRMDKIRPQLCTLVPVGGKSQSPRAVKAQKEKTRLLQAAAEAYRKQPEIEKELDAIAAKHGVKRNEKNIEGKPQMLAGELDGVPVWIESHNQVAAAGISADELWPTNSAPWPSSSTGRNLTGTNVVLGMWEHGGGVNTNHFEFSGRVLQCDSPTNLNDQERGQSGNLGIDLSG